MVRAFGERSGTLRALVYRGPWDIGVESRADPVPGPGEVLLEVLATGICGSDLHGFTGENGRRSPSQVMGHETVCRVVSGDFEPGALVTVNPVLACGECAACKEGQQPRCRTKRVIGVDPALSAAFAELLVAPAANLVALPASMPVELGALVEPLAVGSHAVARGEAAKDDVVLVVGGGPIGQACALAAQRAGVSRLAVSEPVPARRALLEAVGIASFGPSDDAWTDVLTAELGGQPTLVIDAVGSSRSLADALTATDLGGRVVLVGMHTPQLTVPAYAVSVEERTVVGSFCYTDAEFRATAEWVGTAPEGLDRLIEGRAAMADAPESFRALANGDLTASKVLVLPNS
jgi:threonine dehydrogenase-like Zn-dependent dehydrogenase